MGENEEWAQVPSGIILPNGLLPNARPVIQVLDSERWLKAEERTAELIACIQPNSPSEERRNAVADYVQRLIMKCFPCQVFTFGSVPLKTYLPDGDIDLTAFSHSRTLNDSWANQVREILENEEKNENAEFWVKEVQYIKAEVKIIKCLVENIVVDISFNQLGGLCTLCFLEEVDHLISQNHLFKRSIILIKAWCYYESRVLGAHHGLISTYALETLVLYIFHVFNNSFTGPLEVLYRFLEFFSNFDWDNFCVSLWGPVPITSLPDIVAEPPRKDHGELLLSKLFLDACSSVYAVLPGSQENQGQRFVSKHFNVIDPLRINNNLGRSVSKGNFYRIRSAFAFGAKKLTRLLGCPKENLVYEVNQFFTNTWERHGSGNRPDAPTTNLLRSELLTLDHSHGSEILKNGSSAKKLNVNISDWDTEADRTRLHKFPSQHGNYPSESLPTGADPTVTRSQKVYCSLKSSRVFDQAIRESNPKVFLDKGQKTVKPELLVNNFPGKFLFARTRSSPELTDESVGFSPHGRRNKAPESAKSQVTYPRTEINSKMNQGSESLDNYGARTSVRDHSPIKHAPSHQNLDAVESHSCLNSYYRNANSGVPRDELPFKIGVQKMDEEEQDLVNMMANTTLHGLNGQIHMPLNLAPGHLPFPISPSILASMGYGHRNFPGMMPPNIHFIDPSMAQMQFPQALVPPSLAQYYPGIGLNSNPEDMIEPDNGNFVSFDVDPEEGDHDLWREQGVISPGDSISDHINYEMPQPDDKLQSSSSGPKFVPSYRASGPVSSSTNKQKFNEEHRGPIREGRRNQDYGKDYLDDRITASRLSSDGHGSSLRSRTSSESSWDGLSEKVSRTAKEERGKKTAHTEPSSSYEKVKNVSEQNMQPVEDEVWEMHSSMGNNMAERSSPLQSIGSLESQMPNVCGYELAQTSGSESMMPMGPVFLDHGSQERAMDNSGVVFYPTGPPVPFLTMLPVNYIPPETGNADSSTSHISGEESIDNCDPRHHFDPSEKLHQIKELHTNPSRRATFTETSHDKKPDILHSDFASHWQNLLFGRFCQNPLPQGGPVVYPSPVAVPPMYLQGRVPFDGPGRPQSANMDLLTQLMGYGPHLIPVAPFQTGSSRPSVVYQHYVEEIPRQRSGTGTYLPIPQKVSPRERPASGPRRRNSYYERTDSHGDVERSWSSPKSRAAGRNHTRGQNEKSNSRVDRLNSNESRADGPWNSNRRNTFSSYQGQNSHFRSNSSQTISPTPSMTYNMYPVQGMNTNGLSSNGPNVPVMFYPVEHNMQPEQLEFGSFGPMGFSNSNEQRQMNEGSRPRGAFDEQRFHDASRQRSSPDQPSSPHFRRGS